MCWSGRVKFVERISTGGNDASLPLLVGGITAFLFGIVAIHGLLFIVRRHTLMPFVAYRLVLAGVILTLM